MRQKEWKEMEDGCSTIVLQGSGNLYCTGTEAARFLPGFSIHWPQFLKCILNVSIEHVCYNTLYFILCKECPTKTAQPTYQSENLQHQKSLLKTVCAYIKRVCMYNVYTYTKLGVSKYVHIKLIWWAGFHKWCHFR